MKHTLRIPIFKTIKKYGYKLIVAILAFYVPILFASSCASTKSKEAYDLEIVTFYDSPAEVDAFNALIRQFEKATKLRVYVESLLRETYYASLEQYMSSDYPPDILAFHPGWHFHSYAARGYLQPVEALLPGRKFEKSFPSQLRQAASHDSSVMFVPLSWTWWGIFYNKKVLADIGAKLPASLDDLFALAPLLRKGGFIPFTASAKDAHTLSAWIGLFLSSTGDTSLYQGFCSGSVPFNDVKVATALQQFAILIKNKYVIDSAILLNREQALGPLLSGRAAMYLSDYGILKSITKDDRGNIGIASFPDRNGQGIVYADMEGFVVHAKAKHTENARKFLAFISAPENQEAMSLPFSRLPANLSGKQSSPELEATKALLSGTRTVVVSMEQNMPSNVATAVLTEFGNIFSLPSNLPLYLQNLEAKRAALYRKM